MQENTKRYTPLRSLLIESGLLPIFQSELTIDMIDTSNKGDDASIWEMVEKHQYLVDALEEIALIKLITFFPETANITIPNEDADNEVILLPDLLNEIAKIWDDEIEEEKFNAERAELHTFILAHLLLQAFDESQDGNPFFEKILAETKNDNQSSDDDYDPEEPIEMIHLEDIENQSTPLVNIKTFLNVNSAVMLDFLAMHIVTTSEETEESEEDQ